MVSFIHSCTMSGAEAEIIRVECDMAPGLPVISVVGLPDAVVKESKERLRSAIINSGIEFPWNRRITINLSPAGTRKEGTHFDLPMALGLMMSEYGIRSVSGEMVVIGELSLDGSIIPVDKAFPLCVAVREKGIKKVMLPAGNLNETIIIEGMEFYPVEDFVQAHDFIIGKTVIEPVEGRRCEETAGIQKENDVDFYEVTGREYEKRAIEISVGGFHHIMFSGPPGSGKSMMAKRIPTVLPEMTYEEMLEVNKLYRLFGNPDRNDRLLHKRPFRAPGGNVSMSALLGGGNGIPRPGEITLAHNGVLFLDEMPEFRRDVIEALRQPLEDEYITISRAGGKITYPCKFILVGARNPCPCGYYGDVTHKCTCTCMQIKRYRERISGPIMDRFDIVLELSNECEGERNGRIISSGEMKRNICKARKIQNERYRKETIRFNSQLSGRMMKKYCNLKREAADFYREGCEKLGVSRRGEDKILKVARTVADMAECEDIEIIHLAEAFQFRKRKDDSFEI